MVALIKEKDNKLYCSKCRMTQPHLLETCVFCGSTFSNYESMLLKLYEEEEYESYVLNREGIEDNLTKENVLS